jgi:hypothetical protein
MGALKELMLTKLQPGRGKLSKEVAKLSKVVDYFHMFPSTKLVERIDLAGGRLDVEIEHDNYKPPLTIHLTPSPDGAYELKRPRQGRPYLPIRIAEFGLSAKSVPAQAVEETVAEDKIVVKVPPALCPTD